jgi:predicted ATPase
MEVILFNQEDSMSETVKGSDTTIIIKNVRLAFPDLREAVQFNGEGPFSYKATFLVTPGSDADKAILAAIEKAGKNKWGEKSGPIVAQAKASGSGKFCYVDGNTKAYDGFAGNMALSASRSKDDGAPKLLNRDLTELPAESGKPYGGCFVNAKITVWAQDNQYGKAIRATLITVQFVKDGDAFSGSGPANADGMEALEPETDDLV